MISDCDVIIAFSMGKILCRYFPKKAKRDEETIRFRGINSNEEIIVSNKLDEKGNLIVIVPDKRLSNVKCVEYRLLDEQQRRRLELTNNIEKICSKLIKVADKMLELGINNNGNIGIEDLRWYSHKLERLEQTLNQDLKQWISKKH